MQNDLGCVFPDLPMMCRCSGVSTDFFGLATQNYCHLKKECDEAIQNLCPFQQKAYQLGVRHLCMHDDTQNECRVIASSQCQDVQKLLQQHRHIPYRQTVVAWLTQPTRLWSVANLTAIISICLATSLICTLFVQPGGFMRNKLFGWFRLYVLKKLRAVSHPAIQTFCFFYLRGALGIRLRKRCCVTSYKWHRPIVDRQGQHNWL